ncbi:methyl-accepting chemotaxis protein [Marinomonas rhizomae]|uniref:Methyl-accepting chemotaxis sensory transducer with Cache sensor n=1 Tax=Marinomonas rhizomae TaxID=491948 RepID=A0A366J860_9GAMM|nr:methyl-accepting chemotaxis protein [Marinomonas rhizomae]RBP83143.1 methyl-accepting chemotaxis sensory transducer with Cache sensor [Marinomonas rhizomae]RNF72557.1 methyl-accepting chemotaxis protein [Marinomonas rhizomae]
MTFSLRARILSVSILAVVIMTTYLVTETTLSLTQQMHDSLLKDVRHFSKAYGDNTSEWLNSRKAIAESLAHTLERAPDQSPYIAIKQAYESGKFALTYFGNNDGKMYRQDPALDAKRPDYDPRKKDWYKEAMGIGKASILGPNLSSTTKELVIILTNPVIKNGQSFGMVGANLSLDQLSKQVAELNIPGSGSAMMVASNNDIIAHANKNMVMKKAESISPIFAPKLLSALARENTLVKQVLNNHEIFAYAQNIPNTDWTLVFTMNKSELMAPVYKVLVRQIITALVLLAIFSYFLYWLFKILFSDLNRVSKALQDISKGKGDLRARIAVKRNDEIGVLAQGFNDFVNHMHGVVERLKVLSKDLADESHNVSNASTQSASRVATQQQEINQVASAVIEMASATHEIAGNAERAAKAASHSVELGQKGSIQVKQSRNSTYQLANEVSLATEQISALDHHAQQISGILSTITDIAKQTNLLALNAAIEAARAGEHGRGFAVVADEVRTLSQRTHSSTEEIQKMIELLQTQTSKAVTSMQTSSSKAQASVVDADTTTESLEEIANAIITISDMATQIATAAEEQTAVTNEINQNSEIIRQVAADLAIESKTGVEQSKRLSQLAKQVDTEVCQFQT